MAILFCGAGFGHSDMKRQTTASTASFFGGCSSGFFILRALLIAALAAGSAFAADGVIEINQARALAGGVTEGDEPGFPVTLAESGGYLLTGNLLIESASTTAIEITASTVDLDLNGFTIEGPIVCDFEERGDSCTEGSGGWGVAVGPAAPGSRVHDGSIRGMGAGGVNAGSTSIISAVTVTGTGGTGISVAGGIVENCMVLVNHGIGITAVSAVVRANMVARNGGFGISAFTSNVLDNHVMGNRGGISQSGPAVLTGPSVPARIHGNVVADNEENGIDCGSCTVLDNAIFDNGDLQLNMRPDGDGAWGGNNLSCCTDGSPFLNLFSVPENVHEVAPNSCNGARCFDLSGI